MLAIRDLHSCAMKTRHSLFGATGHIMESTNNAAKAAEKGSSIKMKKAKFLLTLAMAAAVTSTAAMSFAQWDVLTSKASGIVTLSKPVTVAATGLDNFTETKAGDDNLPTYSGTVTVAATNVSSFDGLQMKLVPKVSTADEDVTGNFDVVIKEGEDVLADGVDATVIANNTYTVVVTPKTTEAELAKAKGLANAGTELTIEVEATLESTTTT